MGRALGRRPEAVVFADKPKGKPELAPGTQSSGLAFNLAHSGAEVVCAIAFRRYVGVDIEQEREVDPLDSQGGFFVAQRSGSWRRHLQESEGDSSSSTGRSRKLT